VPQGDTPEAEPSLDSHGKIDLLSSSKRADHPRAGLASQDTMLTKVSAVLLVPGLAGAFLVPATKLPMAGKSLLTTAPSR
jgi:hypothetical protein